MSKYTKTCALCGKEFESNSAVAKYCSRPHYKICQDCGEMFLLPQDRLYENKIWCKKCSNKHRIQHISETQSKLETGWNKSVKVYHRICPLCGNEFETHQYNKKYCDNAHYRICEICGKEFPVTRDNLFNKTTTCSEECRVKLSKQTSVEKYGTVNYSQTQEFKDRLKIHEDDSNQKRVETNMKKFGHENYSQSSEWLISQMRDPSKICELKKFIEDPRKYLVTTFDVKPTLSQLSEVLGITPGSVDDRIKSAGINDLVNLKTSKIEQEVIGFLKSLDSDAVIISRDRNQISPYELDVYLPDYSMAIECNSTFTHNSTQPSYKNSTYTMDENYHKTKSDMCDEKGIFLFHIFGYQWTWKQDIVKGVLKQFLRKCDELVEFEDCVVKGVDDLEIEDFFQNYSLRMEGIPDSNLGLYYDETLVAAMIFSTNDDRCEIQEFAENFDFCVPDYQVKFVNYLLEHNNFSVVYGLSNRGYEPNWVFEKCGFEKLNILDPSPTWIDLNTDKVICSQKDKYSVEVYDAGCISWKYRK